MSKNPNARTRPAKRGEPMNNAMKLFLAGCVAELYLLVIRRFYSGHTTQMLACYDTLPYLIGVGAVAAAAGLVLALMWRTERRKRCAAWYLFGGGAFLAVSSTLVRLLNTPALTFLCVAVPVAMLLEILWHFYDREGAWSLTILGVSLLVLWVCRRELGNVYLKSYVQAITGLYMAVVLVIAWLARKADRKGGLVGKVRLLPAKADALPIYVSCGLSFAALAVALVSTAAAYYAIWALAIVAFALAVYYTVKQL